MDQYIDQEQSLVNVCKAHKFEGDLIFQLKRGFKDLKHPSLVMLNLLEILKHKKQVACIEAPKQSGRTLSCCVVLLDGFVKLVKQSKNAEIGNYFMIISASREKSKQAKLIIDEFLQQLQLNIESVDLNGQFPINGQHSNLQLPPQSQSTILFGTYYTFCKLKATDKFDSDCVKYCLFDDCSLAQIYGGAEQLTELSKWINQSLFTVYVADEKLIEQVIGKAITFAKIEDAEDQEEDMPEVEEEENNLSNNNFYYFLTRDQVQQSIVVYITIKLNLIQGKTLILVPNLTDLYYLQLLLQRCNIQRFQIYNHENPKTLKYYILSTFNTGVVNILVSTPQIFTDLDEEFFERKSKGKQPYTLKKVDNMILYKILPSQIDSAHFSKINALICLIQQSESNVETIMEWMQTQKDFANTKEYPIKSEEVEAFRYRIEDTTRNISKNQIKLAEQLDFKKKMLKSPDLAEYFKTNLRERQLLQDSIIKLKKQLNISNVQLPQGNIPEYLLPEVIKKQRKMEGESNKARVLVQVHDKENERVVKKRKLLNQELTKNMLPTDDNVEEEDQNEKYKEKLERYVTINQEEEDPELVDASRLRNISGRKLWKMKHGYKLTKRNKRLERKGIFSA